MDYLPLFEPQLPVPSSDIRQSLKRELVIMHPGYTPQLRLLTLRASDYGSLEYGILYYACCIVAGNVWKPDEGRNGLNTGPFFSKDRLGQDKLILPESNRYLIPAGRYYFHVPGFTIKEPYPIVPSFRDWLPPTTLPKPWESIRIKPPATKDVVPNAQSSNNTSLSTPYSHGVLPNNLRDLSAYDSNRTACVVTFDMISLEEGHVIPKSANGWSTANNMSQFKPEDGLRYKRFIDHPCNKIFLRKDVHTLYNNNYMIIVPKPNSKHPGTYRLGTHVWTPPNMSEDSDIQVFALYQNRPCYPIPHVPVEFWFVRFAWAIFTYYTINILDDDNADKEFAVCYIVNEENGDRFYNHKTVLGCEIDELGAKATGVKGKKRDSSQITQATQIAKKRRQLHYSYRTGEMELESDDDGFESGDHGGFSDYYSEETDDSSDDCDRHDDHEDAEIKSEPSSQHTVPELSKSVLSVGESYLSSDHGDHDPLKHSSLPLLMHTNGKIPHDHLGPDFTSHRD